MAEETNNTPPTELKPDLSLIRNYTIEDQQAEPYAPPFISHFHKGNKDLYYISSKHETSTDSPTFETVRKAIETYKPQLVIIEGLPSEEGMSPPEYSEKIKKWSQYNFAHSFESPYAAYLAKQDNIPFLGGEPSDKAVLEQVQAEGYSTKDLICFYVLRKIPLWRKSGHDDIPLEQLVLGCMDQDHSIKDLPKEERPTFEELTAWYEQHQSGNKTLMQLEHDDFAPIDGPEATYLQRFSKKVGDVRDKNIVTTIGDALTHYDRVLVVYGSSHLTTARPVFEKMFGEKGESAQLVSGELVSNGEAPKPVTNTAEPLLLPETAPGQPDSPLDKGKRFLSTLLLTSMRYTHIAIDRITDLLHGLSQQIKAGLDKKETGDDSTKSSSESTNAPFPNTVSSTGANNSNWVQALKDERSATAENPQLPAR